ncbi:MAG: hypothetical protein P8Z79_17705 [Sedimentisphaerales bacterium]
MDIGKSHVIFVHFPTALALSAVLANFLYAITCNDFFRISGMYCLILAAIAIIPTVYTGWERPETEESKLSPVHLSIAHTHRNLAITSLVLVLWAAIIRVLQKNHLREMVDSHLRGIDRSHHRVHFGHRALWRHVVSWKGLSVRTLLTH